MDISSTTEPRSDQLNFDDVAAISQTVTVADVTRGSAEQPVNIELVEYPGRPYKPSKSMRRVLIAAWGAEASEYKGRQLTLYGDPDVRFAGQAVGGIKIKALSHIDKPVTVNLTVTKGKRQPHTVQVLQVSQVDRLRAEWKNATPERKTEIEAEVNTLTSGAPND